MMKTFFGGQPARNGNTNHLNALKILLPYLWPQNSTGIKNRVLLAALFLILAKIITVGIPFIYKLAVDEISETLDAIVIVPISILIAYGIARVIAQTFGELRDAVFAKVAQRAVRHAALKTFRHLHELSMRFHLDRQTGGLSRAVERGTKGITFLLNFMLFSIIPTLLEILMVCGVMWSLFNFWFSLVTFVTVSIYIIWTFGITEWRIKFRRHMNEMDNQASTKAIDSLLNYETVKYFGNELHEEQRFDLALKSYETAAVKSQVTLSLLNIGQGLVVSLGLTIMMIMAGFGVKNGTLTLGDFVLVNSYLIQLFLPLNFLGFVYREIKQSLTDMDDMFRLLDHKKEIEDLPNSYSLAFKGGNIVFENVSFSYNDNRQILNSVSFDVTPGNKVAVVGPSGSGKSTIARLLFRFYDPTNGRILIDGHDIKMIRQNSLRQNIGVVPQDSVLFNDTIYYNISYGRPDATPSEVENAAKAASIHQFINSLPDGYNTQVGERGLKLSGGEKQRIAIARTLLKSPGIMVFDEATSAMDTHTEKEIQKSLNQASRNRTTIIIAHRLSTVINADEILVIVKGQIVERGTHKELLERKTIYARMWNRQQEARQVAQALEEKTNVF